MLVVFTTTHLYTYQNHKMGRWLKIVLLQKDLYFFAPPPPPRSTYASSLFSNLICPRHICNFSLDEKSSEVLQVIPTKAFTNIIACLLELHQLQPYSKDAWIPCFKALQLTGSDLLYHYGSCTTEIAIFWV